MGVDEIIRNLPVLEDKDFEGERSGMSNFFCMNYRSIANIVLVGGESLQGIYILGKDLQDNMIVLKKSANGEEEKEDKEVLVVIGLLHRDGLLEYDTMPGMAHSFPYKVKKGKIKTLSVVEGGLAPQYS